MKLKYYLRGAGVGLIIATLIFTIALATEKPQMSEKEIIEEAKKLGMVMADDSQDNTQDSAKEDSAKENAAKEDNAKEDAAKEDGAKEDSPKENGTKEDGAKEDSANEATAKEDAAKEDSAKEDTAKEDSTNEATAKEDGAKENNIKEQIVFSVVSGETSAMVSQNLKKADLVDNAEAFDKYLSEKGRDNFLLPGEYRIPKGSSYEEIVKILTTKQ